ncbi:hypothetical protein MJD09_13195, partial [bacterium]|nr:hypothetical protein [bacterium]
ESAIVYSIMNEPPEPLTAVRTGVPMKLEEIVNKLLAKDREERYQNIIELPVDLKNVSLQDTATSRVSSSAITDSIREEKKLTVEVKYSYKTILKVAALVIPSIVLGWLLKPAPPLPEPVRPNKIVVPVPENTSLHFSTYNRMAISPDGRDIVYLVRGGGPRLFLKRAGSFEVTELAGTMDARAPFFSPDGRWIGYLNQRTKEIYKILVDGGEPLKVASYQSSHNRASATWAPDNAIIFAGDVLSRIPESGGEPRILTKTKTQGEQHLYPHMLPDGKTVLFTVGYENAELNSYRLAVYGFGDEDYQVILDEEGYNAVYSATGHILYGRSNRLMGVPFDLKNLKITGIPAPVRDNVQTGRTGSMSYALSEEGTLIYVPGSETETELRSVLSVDMSGRASDFFDLKKQFQIARYSPNGKHVAFKIEENGVGNIWIYHIDGGAINQLTFHKESGANFFAWSPDNKRLAYTTADGAIRSTYLIRIDGTGTAHKISTHQGRLGGVEDWSNDGKKLAFDHRLRDSNWDISVYSFQDSSAKPFLATPAFEADPTFSPNGKWLLYMSDESGQFEIYVRPYPKSSGGVWKISNGGGRNQVWSPDGKKIYYRNGNEMYGVDVTAKDTFSKGNPKKIFERDSFLPFGRRWDIHPDGDRFIMIQRSDLAPQEQKIFVIQNFDEELKRLVPVGKDES